MTAELGSISVSVTTNELEPVAAAQVGLHGRDLVAFTDAAGSATFNDLEPGEYTVVAAKPGYKSDNEKGKVVDVVAGEISEMKMVLQPTEILTTKYHETTLLNGFISCSFHGPPGVVGYTSYCGRGAFISGGPQIGDPNDKSVHSFEIDSAQIQTIVMDVQWTASQAALGTQLFSGTYARWVCGSAAGATGQTCDANDGMESEEGGSPLNYREDEGEDSGITKRLAKYYTEYPAKVYTLHRSACPTGCTFTLTVNQKFDAWATTFYGEAAPADFTALPR